MGWYGWLVGLWVCVALSAGGQEIASVTEPEGIGIFENVSHTVYHPETDSATKVIEVNSEKNDVIYNPEKNQYTVHTKPTGGHTVFETLLTGSNTLSAKIRFSPGAGGYILICYFEEENLGNQSPNLRLAPVPQSKSTPLWKMNWVFSNPCLSIPPWLLQVKPSPRLHLRVMDISWQGPWMVICIRSQKMKQVVGEPLRFFLGLHRVMWCPRFLRSSNQATELPLCILQPETFCNMGLSMYMKIKRVVILKSLHEISSMRWRVFRLILTQPIMTDCLLGCKVFGTLFKIP